MSKLFLVTLLLLSTNVFSLPEQDFQLRFYNGKQAYSDDLIATNFSAGITLEGWFFFDLNSELGTIMKYGGIEDHLGHSLEFFTGDDYPKAYFYIQGANQLRGVDSTVPVVRGEWIHLAISYDNETMRFFTNGASSGESVLIGQLAEFGARFHIGHLYNDGFRGFAREIRVWNKGLSETEVLAVSQNRVSSNDAFLVANWRLNNGSDTVEYDEIANKRLFLGQLDILEAASLEPGWHLTNPFYVVKDDKVENIEAALETAPIGSVNAWGVGDFNHDGLQDFIYNGPESFTELQEVPFRIFVNDGSGSFTEETSNVFDGVMPKAQHPAGRALVVADLNGDDFDDVFSANGGVDSLGFPREKDTLLLSDSVTGKLQDRSDTLLGPPCTLTSPAFAGQRPCGEDGNFTYLYPDRSAEFVVPVDGWGHSSSHADIDNDGDIDIYVGNIGLPGIHLAPYFLINDGEGQFTVDWQKSPDQALNLSFDQRAKTSSKLFDLDDDGFIDLVLGSGGGNSEEPDADKSYVIWGDGSGNYTNRPYFEILPVTGFDLVPTSPLPIDIDNDGNMDLVLAHTSRSYTGRYLQVLKNQGGRIFFDITETALATQNIDGDWIHSITSIDFDSNGCDDILLSTDVQGQVQTDLIWLNDCRGAYIKLPNAVLGKLGFLIPIDAHGDGDLDFIVNQKKIKDFGENPYGDINDFALLEKIRPIDIFEIFDGHPFGELIHKNGFE